MWPPSLAIGISSDSSCRCQGLRRCIFGVLQLLPTYRSDLDPYLKGFGISESWRKTTLIWWFNQHFGGNYTICIRFHGPYASFSGPQQCFFFCVSHPFLCLSRVFFSSGWLGGWCPSWSRRLLHFGLFAAAGVLAEVDIHRGSLGGMEVGMGH